MAVNIGPKIGIDGEKEYRTALQNIVQQQKTLKAEMEATTSAFDKNTTAQEKLRAKTDLLNQQISTQKDRVDKLNEMVQAATDKYGDADTKTLKWKEALANATTELNNMEAELQSLQPNVTSVADKFKDAGEKLKSIGDGVKDVGDKMTKYVTGPIVAVGGASMVAFNEVDGAMDSLRVTTGATGEELSAMEETVSNIATTIPTSFESASAAVGAVATRFEVTGQDLETLSTQFVQFAELTGGDVTSSVDSVQSAMAAWGLSAEDAGAMLDTLLAVSQATGADATKLADDIGANVTVLQDMGMNASDAAWFLGQLDKNGVDSSATMAGLKKALANATADGISMEDALSNLQTTLEGADTDTEAYAAAIELFGNKAGPQLASALQDGRLSLDDLGTALDDNLGNVSSTFEDTVDPIDQLKTTLNELKTTGADLANSLMEVAGPALQALSEKVSQLSEWFKGLDDNQKQTIITVAGVVAAVGPVLSILGSVISTVGTISTAVSTFIPILTGTLIPAVGGVIAAIAPVLPVILGVAAAIAGVVLVVQNWGAISEWFQGVWDTVTTAVGEAWDNVTTAISDAWDSIKTGVTDGINNAKTAIEDGWNNVKTKTTEAWNNVKDSVSNAWDTTKNNVSNAIDSVKTTVSDGWTNLKTKTSDAWSNIKQSISDNGGGIQGVLTTAMDGYKSLWTTGFDTINDITGGRLGDALTTVQDKLESIKTAFSDKLQAAKDAVSNAISNIKNLFNFQWSLPSLKLPHFSWSWTDIGGIISIPNISVSWYKKAYDNPIMFNSPTVMATANGMKGFGDGAGGEIVIGQNTMLSMIRDAVGGAGDTNINVVVNGSPGMDERELADLVADRIAAQVNRRRAAFA
jgi:phage-related minor tail protein